MFRTLDRYVLREWLVIFAIVMGATFGLQLLQAVYDTVPDLLEYKARTGEMLFYYAVRAPSFLSFVLPISVLVSLLYALGQLHRNNEIAAMRSAGVSLVRLTAWIWVAAVVLSGLLFYLNATVIPWSVEQSRIIWNQIVFAHQVRANPGATQNVGQVLDLTYENSRAGRLWLISRFSQYTNSAEGIHVSFLDQDRRELRRVLARKGYWDDVDRNWVLEEGLEIFNPRSADEVQPVHFERRVFTELDDDPLWMLVLLKRPKDLSIFELNQIIASPDASSDPRRPAYAVRFHALLAGTFSCLIVTGLAVPFAVSGVRVNPAVGVSKSIGLFFLYFLLAEIGNLLGEQQTLEPWLAAWLPNTFMIGLAFWLMLRTR